MEGARRRAAQMRGLRKDAGNAAAHDLEVLRARAARSKARLEALKARNQAEEEQEGGTLFQEDSDWTPKYERAFSSARPVQMRARERRAGSAGAVGGRKASRGAAGGLAGRRQGEQAGASTEEMLDKLEQATEKLVFGGDSEQRVAAVWELDRMRKISAHRVSRLHKMNLQPPRSPAPAPRAAPHRPTHQPQVGGRRARPGSSPAAPSPSASRPGGGCGSPAASTPRPAWGSGGSTAAQPALVGRAGGVGLALHGRRVGGGGRVAVGAAIPHGWDAPWGEEGERRPPANAMGSLDFERSCRGPSRVLLVAGKATGRSLPREEHSEEEYEDYYYDDETGPRQLQVAWGAPPKSRGAGGGRAQPGGAAGQRSVLDDIHQIRRELRAASRDAEAVGSEGGSEGPSEADHYAGSEDLTDEEVENNYDVNWETNPNYKAKAGKSSTTAVPGEDEGAWAVRDGWEDDLSDEDAAYEF